MCSKMSMLVICHMPLLSHSMLIQQPNALPSPPIVAGFPGPVLTKRQNGSLPSCKMFVFRRAVHVSHQKCCFDAVNIRDLSWLKLPKFQTWVDCGLKFFSSTNQGFALHSWIFKHYKFGFRPCNSQRWECWNSRHGGKGNEHNHALHHALHIQHQVQVWAHMWTQQIFRTQPMELSVSWTTLDSLQKQGWVQTCVIE